MSQHATAPLPTITQTKALSAEAGMSDYRSFARMGYVAILLSFGGFGTWATFAPLDSAAVASGQVAVTSDRKPIAHLEGGIVKEVLVSESQRVKAGQVLFKLQPIQAQSNSDLLQKQLDAVTAQEARLLAERDLALRIKFPEAILARRQFPETAAAIYDQEKQFAERKRSMETQVDILKRRIDQANNDINGKIQREASLKAQLGNLQSEITAVSGLAERGFYPKNKLLANQREMFRIQGDLGQARSDIARTHEQIEETKVEIRLTRERQVDEASLQLAEVRIRLSEIREKLSVAADVLSRVDVRAPQDGIVQGLKVHAVGAVVRPGEPMAEIVTPEDGLLMSAQVKPTDIDSVQPGQKAEIRFPAFTSRQKEPTMGKVETVSADAMFDTNTKQSFFLVRVSIDLRTLPLDLREKLTPGMPATVLITTGERTLLKFLVGPLTDALARTMRDR